MWFLPLITINGSLMLSTHGKDEPLLVLVKLNMTPMPRR